MRPAPEPALLSTTVTFTANYLCVGEDPLEILLDDVGGEHRPRYELLLSVEKGDLRVVDASGTQTQEVAQLYAEFNEPTNFYPDGDLQWDGNFCRDGIQSLTLSADGLGVRFSEDANMGFRNAAPPVNQRLLVRNLIVRFAGSEPQWLPRLEDALQRLCQATESYTYQAAGVNALGRGTGGGTVTFRLSDRQRRLHQRVEAQAARDQRLFDAVRGGDVVGAGLALDQGANPNAANYADFLLTPLMGATQSGQVVMARLLLERGAQIDGKDAFERTALICAATAGQAEVVRLLLERGADVHANAKEIDFGHYTGTALDEALRQGHTEIVTLLCGAGAREGTIRERFGQGGGGFLLCTDGDGEVPDPGEAQRKTREALIVAVERGDVETVRLCVGQGADPNLCDEDGSTLLHMAAAFGHGETLRLLLEYGASIVAQDTEGWTALMQAADHGHLGICALLLEYGADPQDGALRNAGETALVLAALRGDLEIVRLLLERTDATGNVALVELLLKQGARMQLPHLDIALRLVLQDRDMRMAQKLRELGARESQPVGESPDLP
ncbi:hypothetical protein Egran_07148 [Elaphomyces granulatus]|uniref:Uncharacterized protein n=1 Tax=Elaphomyces granulatus TaxID=519963 RepID=A0A232LLT7_9EURO|nr:hypothetical protein Egran_07148 [Elaphomyces granulatus]